MDIKVETQECRTCGQFSSMGKNMLPQNHAATRCWIEKTLNLKFSEGSDKSNFICSQCSDRIRTWITFRASYQKAQKYFARTADGKDLKDGILPAETPKPKGVAGRQQKRLDDWLSAKPNPLEGVSIKEEVVEKKPVLPLRLKLEPKIERDLFDTDGMTDLPSISPVKVQVKEELMEIQKLETMEDDKSKLKDLLLHDRKIKPRGAEQKLRDIKLKFKRIGNREKRRNLLKMQKLALNNPKKKTRESLPPKNPRKSQPTNLKEDSDDNKSEEDMEVVTSATKAAPSPQRAENVVQNIPKQKPANRPMPQCKKPVTPLNKKNEPSVGGLARKRPADDEDGDQEPVLAKRKCMPLSVRKKIEEGQRLSKEKKDEVKSQELSESVPAKRRCMPLSARKKLEEAQKEKENDGQKEVVLSSSGSSSDDDGNEEEAEEKEESSHKKPKSLLDYFPPKFPTTP